MTENLDKYRALHEFVTDPSKAELFGMGGLFGGLKEDHTVLKLFGTFINELKREYGYVPETIDSETFIEYIESDLSLDEGKKKAIIQKIQYLTKKGIIQGQPVYTLYNFAVVLNDLDIGEKKELITIGYERALESVFKMGPQVRISTGSNSPSGSGQPEKVRITKMAEPFSVLPKKTVPENGPEKQETDEFKTDQTEEEEDKELSVSEEDKEETSLEAEEVIEPTKGKKRQILSVEPATAPGTEPVMEQAVGCPEAGSPTDNGLSKPNLSQESDNENPQEPQSEEYQQRQITEIEQFKTTGLKSLPLEETGKTRTIVPGQGQGQSQIQSQMQAVPQRVAPRRVISTGKGLRRPMKKPERLSELSPKEVQSSKDAQKTEKEAQQDQQSADQIPLIPQRSTTEGGSTRKDKGEGSSFGKKLAKLAGAGVGAGVILPLFAGGSAKAADFSLHTDFPFIHKIISLLF